MAGIAALVAAVASVLIASFVVALTDVSPHSARAPFLIVSGVVVAAVVAWFLILPLVRRLTDDWIAVRLGQMDSSVGDELVNAVQLNRDGHKMAEDYFVSETLIAKHVERVADRAAEVSPKLLADWNPLKRYGRTAAFAMVGYGVLTLVAPQIASRGRALITGIGLPENTDALPVTRKQVAGAAQIGDFTVTYNYPEYTGRQAETIPGASGNLQAIKGTIAQLTIATDRPVSKAEIVIGDDSRLPLEISEDGQSLSGQITILEDSSYYVEAQTDEGRESQTEPRTITVESDRTPSVEILYPPSIMVVNEVEEVPIAWTAEDDFGLRSATLVYEVGGKKERIRLWSPISEESKRTGGTYRWSLATLELDADNPVTYWVEAADTDTISGPKIGRSATHTLKVLSSEEIHAQVIAMQEELLRQMVSVLADHLESDVTGQSAKSDEQIIEVAERLSGRIAEVTTGLTKVLDTMLDDPLGDEGVYVALQEMRGDLIQVQDDYNSQVVNLRLSRHVSMASDAERKLRRGMALVHVREASTVELEQDILFLEDLILKQRLDAAAQEMQRLVKEQKELRELLEKYKNGEASDDEMAKMLEAKLADLEQRMAEMAQRMASSMPEIADTFQNEQFTGEDIMSQIRKAIEEGRMDDAMALAEQMLASMEQAMQGFEQSRQRMTIDPETLQQMQKAKDELAKIREEQEKIVNETQNLRDDIRERMDQQSKEKIPQFIDEAMKKVEKLKEQVEEMNEAGSQDPWMRGITRGSKRMLDQSIGNLEESLKAQELGDAQQHAQDTERSLEGLAETAEQIRGAPQTSGKTAQKARQAQRTAQSLVDDLNKLKEQFQQAATPQQRRQMGGLQQRQQQLQQRAQQLGEQMQQMGQQTPFLPGRTGQKMQGAAQSMQQAGQRLGQGNAASALPSEREAARQMAEAQQDLENAMRGSRPGQNNGQPLGQRMGMRSPRDGRNGFNTRPIEIPDPSQYKPPKEFRDDIIKAMKKPSPEGYQELNEDYYERLVK